MHIEDLSILVPRDFGESQVSPEFGLQNSESFYAWSWKTMFSVS